MATPERTNLSIKDAATRLGVSTRTIRRLIDSDDLIARNVCAGKERNRWRISAKSFDAFLKRRQHRKRRSS